MRPFYLVDTRMQRKYDGTGLGLPLVKVLAVVQGGCLDLRGTMGAGTGVSVRFPPEFLIAHPASA